MTENITNNPEEPEPTTYTVDNDEEVTPDDGVPDSERVLPQQAVADAIQQKYNEPDQPEVG